MSTIIFGEPWDAPICETAIVMPTAPTYVVCIRCDEPIAEGDQGFVLPEISADGELPDVKYRVGEVTDMGRWAGSLVAEHRECQLASVMGHGVGVCSCTGWDTFSRATGREVLRRIEQRS